MLIVLAFLLQNNTILDYLSQNIQIVTNGGPLYAFLCRYDTMYP